MTASTDICIIGSGIGGSTMAYGLASTGAKITILERGQRLHDTPETRDADAIFKRGHFRSGEQWYDGDGVAFTPGNYYNVGGNSKYYGAVLYRYRKEDFVSRQHLEGVTQSWPFDYDEMEPWYCKAEELFQVRGALGEDPTEPPHSRPYPHPPVPLEPAIADAAERLKKQGLNPCALPLGVDIDAWLKRAKTPWDAFPDTFTGKMDAETRPLASALQNNNVSLRTGCHVTRLELDPAGRKITAVVFMEDGVEKRLTASHFILATGTVNSAVLLMRSDRRAGKHGVANSSGVVGKYFMNHNSTAMVAIDPRKKFDTVYQKNLALNDFYINDPVHNTPLGNVQLLGKISGPIFKANAPLVPEFIWNRVARSAVDWYLMSEDLPSAESRVYPDGDRIVMDWKPTNRKAHMLLVERMRNIFKDAGYPFILTRTFGKHAPSHQAGTVRMGTDPATAALDPYCRSYDHSNLFVVDGSFLPSSAAVNPVLTIVAQALRVSDHLRKGHLN